MGGGGLYRIQTLDSCFYSYNKASEPFSLLIGLAGAESGISLVVYETWTHLLENGLVGL